MVLQRNVNGRLSFCDIILGSNNIVLILNPAQVLCYDDSVGPGNIGVILGNYLLLGFVVARFEVPDKNKNYI